MKIRFGFVSNSSSSSFIVAADKNNTKIKVEIDLVEINGVDIVKSEKELEKALKDNYYLPGDEDYKHIKNDCMNYLKQGLYIIFGNVSNESGSDMEQFLYRTSIPESKNIRIIQNISN